MHFKTEHNNKVVLKADRYLNNKSSYLGSSKVTIKEENSQRSNQKGLPKLADQQQGSKEILSSNKINKELLSLKMKRIGNNLASHYKKDEIVRNKVLGSHKLFRMAR